MSFGVGAPQMSVADTGVDMDETEASNGKSSGAQISPAVSSGPRLCSINTKTLAMIMENVKKNPTSEKSQEVLNILKQNPVIMAKIIQQRQINEAAGRAGGPGGALRSSNGPQTPQQEVITMQAALEQGSVQQLYRGMANMQITASTQRCLLPYKNWNKMRQTQLMQYSAPYPQCTRDPHMRIAEQQRFLDGNIKLGGAANVSGVPIAGIAGESGAAGSGTPRFQYSAAEPGSQAAQQQMKQVVPAFGKGLTNASPQNALPAGGSGGPSDPVASL